MDLKIEKIPIPARSDKNDQCHLWETVKSLKPGESFLWPKRDSNIRNGLSIAQHLLGTTYVTRREGEGFRIFRIN